MEKSNNKSSYEETKRALLEIMENTSPSLFTRILPNGITEFKMWAEDEWKDITETLKSPIQS